ncbi:hypothetical protein BJ508DRAFT_412674 [Ascobolus immersus RN42]|uniref:Uncharacterized protein n=1 Tax=Ascobolus immersus RN42 TaxID=1160509 RepID=A0A3N4IIS7_ASCIM|nr:hypothetical protein BJ508DRAFT_412674 [Ascobolus immersus RN42]
MYFAFTLFTPSPFSWPGRTGRSPPTVQLATPSSWPGTVLVRPHSTLRLHFASTSRPLELQHHYSQDLPLPPAYLQTSSALSNHLCSPRPVYLAQARLDNKITRSLAVPSAQYSSPARYRNCAKTLAPVSVRYHKAVSNHDVRAFRVMGQVDLSSGRARWERRSGLRGGMMTCGVMQTEFSCVLVERVVMFVMELMGEEEVSMPVMDLGSVEDGADKALL